LTLFYYDRRCLRNLKMGIYQLIFERQQRS
jgi:hypothetical protein